MPDNFSNPSPNPRPRNATLVAAALLLGALALVVLYTSRRAFLSPMAMVVIAAIGVAALILQIRLRPDLSSSMRAPRAPLWLNALGVLFALGAVFADLLHLDSTFMLITALAAVVCFAVSGIVVLSALRKHRV